MIISYIVIKGVVVFLKDLVERVIIMDKWGIWLGSDRSESREDLNVI